MPTKNKAWQNLIDVIFNDEQDVPIELISEFRKIADLHMLGDYSNYLRNRKLPETLKKDPWEWKHLEDLSKVLPEDKRILILKGGAIRDMEIYPFPSLRKSTDLDIFISGVKQFEEQKRLIEYLAKNKLCDLQKDWEIHLRKLKLVTAKANENYIDLHFELFSPLGNSKNPPIGSNTKIIKLENQIVNRAVFYRSLRNIKKMSYEDYWFYSIFHFLKDFPIVRLHSMLDAFLILKQHKSSLEKLKIHGTGTNQAFLYNVGIYMLSQLSKDFKQEEIDTKLNWVTKRIFKVDRIISINKYSIKNRLIAEFSKGAITANGNLFQSLTLGLFYLIRNNIIESNIGITKFLYLFSRVKNVLKNISLKFADIETSKQNEKFQIIPSRKKLISVKIEDLKLTFFIPIEFYYDLEKIWKGFLSEEHLDENINVEKITAENQTPYYETVFSKNSVYLKLAGNSNGIAKLDSSGTFFAKNFWDVRTFALTLFRAKTFEREDLLLVHSGAVKINDETLLFPGGSSCGKTTFFNLLTKHGAIGINDDTLLLKKEDNTWNVYPTPFISRNQEPIICEKNKLTGIIDLIKVCGGHEIKSIDMGYIQAILVNNSIGDFIIDDAGYIASLVTSKVLDISKQIKYRGQIKFAKENTEQLFELINRWLNKPNENFLFGSDFIRLIELRGKSMEPTFKDGDILLVEEIYPEKLKPKDIICYTDSSNKFPIVHRIKYIIRHDIQTTLITKGDNSIYEDPPNIFNLNQKLLKVIDKTKK